jgi:predicted metal-dependent hydrolase
MQEDLSIAPRFLRNYDLRHAAWIELFQGASQVAMEREGTLLANNTRMMPKWNDGHHASIQFGGSV